MIAVIKEGVYLLPDGKPSRIAAAPCACRCGCHTNGISEDLVAAVDAIIRRAGDPDDVEILSGVRCVRHNKKEGGAPNSAHLFRPGFGALGIDIRTRKTSPSLIWAEMIKSKTITGAGIYESPLFPYFHFDVMERPSGRLFWEKLTGKPYKYFTDANEALKSFKRDAGFVDLKD